MCHDLNVYQVLIIAKEKIIEQELLSKINSKNDFMKKWTHWKDLFSELKKWKKKKYEFLCN